MIDDKIIQIIYFLQTAGGFQPAPVIVTPPERDWTVPAVMVTLCCFFPTGICAIIAAVNVSAILAEIRTRKKCYTEEINDLIESTL